MRPVRLQIEGFLSYRQKTTLDFAGIRAAAIVGENGAGKTSLVEAMTWSLFGKGRGRGPDDFISSDADVARVTFEFELAGQRFTVYRERKRNGKTELRAASYAEDMAGYDIGATPIGGDRIAETQAAIEDLLGMSFEVWTASSFIGQGRADAFTAQTPAERKATLFALLELDQFTRLHDLAVKDAKDYQASATHLQGQVDLLKAEIDRLADSADVVGDLEDAARALEANATDADAVYQEAQDRLAEARSGVERARQSRGVLDALVAENDRLRTDLEMARTRLEEATDRARGVETVPGIIAGIEEGLRLTTADRASVVQMIENEVRMNQELDAQTVRMKQEADLARKRLASLMQSGGECFTCGTALEPGRVEDLRSGLEATIETTTDRIANSAEEFNARGTVIRNLQRDVRQYDESLAEQSRRRDEAKANLTRAQEAVVVRDELADRVRDLENAVAAAGAKVVAARATAETAGDLDAAFDRAVEDVKNAKMRVDLIAAEQKRNAADLGAAAERLETMERASAQVREANEGLEKIRTDVRTLETLAAAWGRDGIPALLLESAIPDLELHANAILERLAGTRFRIAVETLKATKTAGVKESLEIRVADGVADRALEALSGGERQMVDIAIRVGLSRLLAHRAGRKIETLVIDEGFTALDEDHRQRTIELLADLADEFPVVLFVTHLRELADAFETRLIVQRTDDGSVLEMEGAMV